MLKLFAHFPAPARRSRGGNATALLRRDLVPRRYGAGSATSWAQPQVAGGTMRRSLVCSAAVNAQSDAKSAVDDCLDRVLGAGASSPCDFAVLFFEGHQRLEVQEALTSFAQRYPQAPPVVGCSLGDGREQQRQTVLKAKASSSQKELQQLQSSFRSPAIVTVLGLGFGGRVEAIPVSAEGGCFPSIAGEGSIAKIFSLPKEKQPVFLLLCRPVVPVSDLEDSFRRLGNLLPGGTSLSALSSGTPACVVSSFSADTAPIVGVCLLGDISLEEQAELARKTLGAFGLEDVRVSGRVCEELFVPSHPASALRKFWKLFLATGDEELDADEGTSSSREVVATNSGAERKQDAGREEQGQRRRQQQQQQQQHELCVFAVEDFVFPGMTRRFYIFEPRYRALVKRCLQEGEPLVILPLSRGGNTIGTAAYVSGLHNVEDDGRCEIEVTGLARCDVKTMWMKGESFGLQAAVVEFFEDRKPSANGPAIDGEQSAGGRGLQSAANVAAAAEGGGGGEGSGGNEQDLVADLPELERLRIQVATELQRELFRTRKLGRSPLWPMWNGEVKNPTSSSSSIDRVGGGTGGAASREGADETEVGASDPSDLDAEALSYWAAHYVEADVLTKHRWLTCTDTEDRLREIRGVCRATMERHRERIGLDGGMLGKPLSALKDILPK